MPQSSARLIAVTDQSIGRILVFDFDLDGSLVEGCPPGTVWCWQPDSAAWGRPSDVRLRRDGSGAQCMLVADSYGLAAVVGADGELLWCADVGPTANPHAAELLPNGRVAVAASTAGWVRVYAGLSAPHDERFVEFRLPGAHGVLWDQARGVLWVLGTDRLCSLRPSGDATVLAPLTDDELPSRGGHDLQPVYENSDLLWLTTSSEVYQFSTSGRSWSTTYPHATSANRANVKSVGSNPLSGEILQTVPAPGAVPEWVTDTIDICAASRRSIRSEGQFYKARYWIADPVTQHRPA